MAAIHVVPDYEVLSEDNNSSNISVSENQQGAVASWAILVHADRSADFKKFKLDRGYSKITIGFIIFDTLINFWRIIRLLRFPGATLMTQVVVCVSLLVPICEWIYIHLLKKHLQGGESRPQGETRIIWLGNATMMLQSACMGLLLLSWSLGRNSCESAVCWEDFPEHIIPLPLLSQVICIGVAMPLVFSCHSTIFAQLSLIISYSLLFTTGLILKMPVADLLVIVSMFVFTFFTVVTYEYTVYLNYKSFSKFEFALRKKVESENKELLMKIQTEEMRNMIGNVAHDLRTPLQAFQSEIELLRECIKNDDTPEKQKFQRKSITQLGRICHFMNMTINRSIDFTKASSGIKLNPSIESISFSDTMTWAVGCMVTTQGTVPIVLEPIPTAIHGYIYTDKQWLMENMLCLLSNAQKFTTEGAITIRCSLHSMFQGSVVQSLISSSTASKKHFSDPIGGRECNGRSRRDLSSWREKVAGFVDLEIGASTTVTESAAPMLLIEIEDSGIGITKENREKLFQPFMQAQRRTGGTGLGLYSLSKRMESLGGNCGVETRSDGASGSCFWIAIPYRPDESMSNSITEEKVSSQNNFNNDDLEEEEDYSSPKLKKMESWGASAVPVSYDMVPPMNSSDETPVFAEQHRGLRILLVDDSTLIRKATSRSLCQRGYRVEVAQHGAECLKLLEASQDSSGAYGFDLVLMDLQMPVMDGLEATRRIRTMENSEEKLRTAGDNKTSKSHITIIGVSAHTEGEARAECADCGMDSFIEKPLQMKHLQECILSMGITQKIC